MTFVLNMRPEEVGIGNQLQIFIEWLRVVVLFRFFFDSFLVFLINLLVPFPISAALPPILQMLEEPIRLCCRFRWCGFFMIRVFVMTIIVTLWVVLIAVAVVKFVSMT